MSSPAQTRVRCRRREHFRTSGCRAGFRGAALGARDLPFPRLSAYALWAYLAGGLVFFGTIFFDMAPDGGWFMYPPLTSWQFSPGLRADFWLLGIGFIEISAGWAASSVAMESVNRTLRANVSRTAFGARLIIALILMWAAFSFNFLALWNTNVRPQAHAYGAVIYTMLAWQALHVVLLTLMAGYTLARSWAGLLNAERRSTFDNTRLMWHYTIAQGAAALAVMYTPRIIG